MQNNNDNLGVINKPSDQLDKAIADRLFMIEDGIVYFKEISIPTLESIDLMYNGISKLTAEMDNFFLIVDLTEASKPKAKERRKLNLNFSKIAPNIQHLGVIATNPLLKIALRFVIHYSSIASYSIHANKEEALKQIEDVIK